jgi:hypothetical protein
MSPVTYSREPSRDHATSPGVEVTRVRAPVAASIISTPTSRLAAGLPPIASAPATTTAAAANARMRTGYPPRHMP